MKTYLGLEAELGRGGIRGKQLTDGAAVGGGQLVHGCRMDGFTYLLLLLLLSSCRDPVGRRTRSGPPRPSLRRK